MRLYYQTGTATFIQLAVVVFLIVLNNLVSFLHACISDSGSCVASAFVSLVMIIGAALWFTFLSALGYAAQEKRSRRLAHILIAGQAFTALMALSIARLPGGWFAGLSALVVCAISLWIALLAYRLSKSKGGRIVQRPRTRKRLAQPEES